MDPEAHACWRKYTCDEITTLSWDPESQSHIPFRAAVNHTHHTWAKTHYSKPELYIKPQTLKEIKLTVDLARQCYKRILVVGSGHSPSDITCANAGTWMVNLDNFNNVIGVDRENLQVTVEAGIRLHALEKLLSDQGWAMPNMGSILDQSIAGAIATGTHGSSLYHGLLSSSVVALGIMTSSGDVMQCSSTENPDLYQSALIALGGLGIVVQVTFQAVPAFKLSWKQEIITLPHLLERWISKTLWESAEYVRVWWFPYSNRTVTWSAQRTEEEESQESSGNSYGSLFTYHAYQFMLYIARWIPPLTSLVEKTFFRLEYGWDEKITAQAVQGSADALRMNCWFPQFVNEWAIPLRKGPEAITRLQAWLMGDQATSNIPFSPFGVYVHAPIEVRVSDSSRDGPLGRKALLDPACDDEPTLYINATLYRPYLSDIPSRITYYRAFEYLMKELGGRPHWAKNFVTVDRDQVRKMYGERLDQWIWIRDELDPLGMFTSNWLETNLLGEKNNDVEREIPDEKLVSSPAAGDLISEEQTGQKESAAATGIEFEEKDGSSHLTPRTRPKDRSAAISDTSEDEDAKSFERMASSVESFELVQRSDEE